MHPIIAYEATKERLAALRRRAERNRWKHGRHAALGLATVLARRRRRALAACSRWRLPHDPVEEAVLPWSATRTLLNSGRRDGRSAHTDPAQDNSASAHRLEHSQFRSRPALAAERRSRPGPAAYGR